MSSYRIRRGDTLSALARRFHTNLKSLMKANPRVKNANRIRAGASLNVPGSRDEFVRGGHAASRSRRTAGRTGAAPAGHSQASSFQGAMPAGNVGQWIKQATDV